MEFAHPSIEFNTSQDVWSSPNSADALQYLSDQSGLFATAPQRFSSWRALDGADGVTRYVRLPFISIYNIHNLFDIGAGCWCYGRIAAKRPSNQCLNRIRHVILANPGNHISRPYWNKW